MTNNYYITIRGGDAIGFSMVRENTSGPLLATAFYLKKPRFAAFSAIASGLMPFWLFPLKRDSCRALF
jgi:hypothetical protein